MASFRDMLNSKLKNTKQQVQMSKTYDQSWLKITAVGGQTQLCPIKLSCVWTNPGVVSKAPILTCKWFIKTENSMNQILGIFGTYYQPTLNDVGSKIQVQCMPELQGIQYEGMPITVQVGPIKLDPETQQQASDFLQAKKATFFIKIKKVLPKLQHPFTQGLLKIVNDNLRLMNRANNNQKQIFNISITDQNPDPKSYSTSPKQLELKIKQDVKVTIQFNNNKIRDVFLLLIKLTLAKSNQKLFSLNKIEEKTESQINSDIQNDVEVEQQIKSPTKIEEVSQQMVNKQEEVNNVEQEEIDTNKSGSKSNKISQPNSLQNLDSNKKYQAQSSDDITKTSNNQKNQFVSPPSLSHLRNSPTKTRNTQQYLQIADLKKQVHTLQTQIFLTRNQSLQKDEINYKLEQQLSIATQRSRNLNNNFFILEEQLKKNRKTTEINVEQVSYYKNQARLLKKQNQNLENKVKDYVKQINQLDDKLKQFFHENQERDQMTYFQLKYKYQLEIKGKEQIQNKCSHLYAELLGKEDAIHEIKQSMVVIQQERDYYRKKFENLANQLQNHTSPNQMMLKSSISIKSQNGQKIEEQQKNITIVKHMEEQLLSLKKQLKRAIQENDFLRAVNSSTKDKKSSKTQLKLDLIQTKKIVNRLTQAVTQKDLALQHLRQTNKGLNLQLQQMRKQFNQLRTKQE